MPQRAASLVLRRGHYQVGVVLWLCGLLAAGVLGCRDRGESSGKGARDARQLPRAGATVPDAVRKPVVAALNRGVGLMEQGKPLEAIAAFDELVRLAPQWPAGHVNLGIALLNSEEPENYPRAEQELRDVLAGDPHNLHAHFSLAMLLMYLTRLDEARPHFEEVVRADPLDADSHFQLAVLLRSEDPAAAQQHLETALALVPHHESASYLMQSVLRQRGQTERADQMLEQFNRLRLTGAGHLAGTKYGEMGRYAMMIRGLDDPHQPAVERAADPADDGLARLRWRDVAADRGLTAVAAGRPGWPGESGAAWGPGVGVADVNGDGQLDIYLPGGDGDAPGTLYLGDGQHFQPIDTAIDGRGAHGAFFGDFDRDGDADLYLTCTGANRLYRNDGQGQFEDVTAVAGVAGGGGVCLGAHWVDADHDGDLDLLAYGVALPGEAEPDSAVTQLFRNNGDGSFARMAAEAFAGSTLAAAAIDLDGDRDLDFVLVGTAGPHRVLLNDRLGRFREAGKQYSQLAVAGDCVALVVGDVDGDGRDDVLALRGPHPPRLLVQRMPGTFVVDERFERSLGQIGGAVNAVLGDADLDGHVDVVLLGVKQPEPASHAVLRGLGGGRFARPVTWGPATDLPSARGALAADFRGDGHLEWLVAHAGRAPELWQLEAPEANRHWLEVVLDARPGEKKSEPKPDFTGARIEAVSGEQRLVRTHQASAGYSSSPPQRVHFGLGAAAKLDYVRIAWPDALFQVDLEVAANQQLRVVKQAKKASSCPVLFSWDGARFAFVADFAGGGGLGFFAPPESYAPPDPVEVVRIAPGMIQPRNNHYEIRVVEPLEEITYLDALQLIVYDHPSDCELFPDERFGGSAPATGEPLAIRTRRHPVSAKTDSVADVRERLLEVDRQYVEAPADERFEGFAQPHFLELDFGELPPSAAQSGRWVLLLHGWVEYTYSHVAYAAAQAGLTLRAPELQVPDDQGGWRTAIADLGFPGGLPRTMSYDVTPLIRAGETRFRLTSNMRVFWDQILLAPVDGAAPLVTTVLPASRAELRPLGYPREYSPDGNEPTLYDYQRLDRGLPFKNFAGRLTRFGNVLPLVRDADDQFVVFGRGEELALEFDTASLPALPALWRRTVMVHSDAYCKDMDLYTAYPDTVEPLPYHGMQNYPPAAPRPSDADYAEYLRRWNTRELAR